MAERQKVVALDAEGRVTRAVSHRELVRAHNEVVVRLAECAAALQEVRALLTRTHRARPETLLQWESDLLDVLARYDATQLRAAPCARLLFAVIEPRARE